MPTPRHLIAILLAPAVWPAIASVPAPAQGLVHALPPTTADPLAGVAVSAPDGWGDVGHVGSPAGWAEGPYADLYSWHVLPDGLVFPAYLAGGRESRFASQWIYEPDQGWLWDIALGGHLGILRYGTDDPLLPKGFQLDVEGAAFPRLSLKHNRKLVSTDFRFGVPLTYREGVWEGKLAYYHLSSHLGDELLLIAPGFVPINYTRDVLVLAIALRPSPDWRVYAEAGWAFYTDGGSEPWEFQFGGEYSPAEPSGILPAPFFAVNGRIREEVDFGGNLTVQTGLQWRGQSGRLFRTGFHYLNGRTDAYQFFRQHEEQFGIGVWYDF